MCAVPGIGLGLSITMAIAQAHGGTVRVASTEGQGTSFTVDAARVAGGSRRTLVGCQLLGRRWDCRIDSTAANSLRRVSARSSASASATWLMSATASLSAGSANSVVTAVTTPADTGVAFSSERPPRLADSVQE